MRTAVEVFTMTIIITVACIMFSSMISITTQNSAARDYYNLTLNRIEDSNFNLMVINECVEEAEEKGYELTIKDVTVYDDKPSKLILMNYTITIPIYKLLGQESERKAVIEGYAI